jgi:hypothetical protein
VVKVYRREEDGFPAELGVISPRRYIGTEAPTPILPGFELSLEEIFE